MANSITAQGEASRLKKLNSILWAMQVFLFLAFFTLGLMKLTSPIDKLERLMTWPGVVPVWLVRLIGGCELAGALGVLLPALTHRLTGLIPYAAMGLTAAMICAVGYHLMLFQGLMMLPSMALGVIAGYVAWGRDQVMPIRPR